MSNRQIAAIQCQVSAITKFVTSRYSTCADVHAVEIRQALRQALSEVSDDCKYRAEKRRCVARMERLNRPAGRGAP